MYRFFCVKFSKLRYWKIYTFNDLLEPKLLVCWYVCVYIVSKIFRVFSPRSSYIVFKLSCLIVTVFINWFQMSNKKKVYLTYTLLMIKHVRLFCNKKNFTMFENLYKQANNFKLFLPESQWFQIFFAYKLQKRKKKLNLFKYLSWRLLLISY